MTDVITKTGEIINMPPEEARAAILRGEVAFDSESENNKWVTSNGNMEDINADTLIASLQMGAQFIGKDAIDRKKRIEEWDTTGGAMATAAAGMGNALTLGMMDAAGTQLLGEEYAQSRRDMMTANPGSDLLGAIGGNVLGIMGTGGIGAVLKGGAKLGTVAASRAVLGATPGAIATTASLAIEARTAAAVGGMVGKGVLAKTVSMAAGGAAEALTFEAGRALSQASIQEGDHSAEEIMMRMGEWASKDALKHTLSGAGWGGAIGGVFGLTGRAIGAARGKRSAAERAAGKDAPRRGNVFDNRAQNALNDPEAMDGLSDFGQEILHTTREPGGDIVQDFFHAQLHGSATQAAAKRKFIPEVDSFHRVVAEEMVETRVHTANINNIAGDMRVEPINAMGAQQQIDDFFLHADDAFGIDTSKVKALEKQQRTLQRDLKTIDRLDERGRVSQAKLAKQFDKQFDKLPAKGRQAAKAERARLKKAVTLDDLKKRAAEAAEQEPPMRLSAKQRAQIADLEAEGIGSIQGSMDDVIERIRGTKGIKEGDELLEELAQLERDASREASAAAGKASTTRNSINGDLWAVEQELEKRAIGEGYDEASRAYISKGAQAVSEAKAAIAKARASGTMQDPMVAARVYANMDVLTRKIGKQANERSGVRGAAKDILWETYERLRAEMIDQNIWGKTLALKHEELQAAHKTLYDAGGGADILNAGGKGVSVGPFDEAGNLRTRNRRVLGRDVEPIAGRPDTITDPARMARFPTTDTKKASSFIDDLGDFEHGTQEQAFLKGIEARAHAVEVISRVTKEISPAKAATIRKHATNIRKHMADGARPKLHTDAYKRSLGIIGKAMDIGTSRIGRTGLGAGGFLLGDITGAGLGLALGSADNLIARVGSGDWAKSLLSGLRKRGVKSVDDAVDGIINNALGAKVSTRARVRGLAIPASAGSSSSERDRFKYGAKLTRDFQQDSQAAVTRGVNAMGPMATATPSTSAMFGSRLFDMGTYLAQKLPALPRGAAFGKDDQDKLLDRVSRSEMRKFNRIFEAVGNPIGVLQDLATGNATREAVEALEAAYPLAYQGVTGKLQKRLSELDEDIPFTTLMEIGRLFQIPVHPAMFGDRIASIQMIAREASNPQRSDSAIAPSRAVAPDMAAEFATRSQQIAGKVRG